MKIRPRSLVWILAAGALVAPAAAGAARAPVRAAARAQLKHEEFLTRFRQAMSINAKDEMVKLLKVYPEEAVARVVYTCEQIAAQPSDELETLIAALRQAWEGAYATGFVDHVYRYFSFLDPVRKREQTRLREAFDRAANRYTEAVAKKDGAALELLSGELAGLAESFEGIGDLYHASQAWIQYGTCHDEPLRGQKADLEKVAVAFGRALELRRKIELTDPRYALTKERYDRLVKEGWVAGAPPTGAPVEPGADPSAPAEPAAAVPLAVPMSFAVVASIEEFARPSYVVDELYAMWNSLSLGPKGSSARFHSMPDGPNVVRHGSSDVRIDANRNGSVEDDGKIPITGQLVPVEVTLGEGPEERRWAFLAVTGTQKELYQGIELNLQPDDQHFNLYTINAASMVGAIAGTPVRVIDDNMDGVYGSKPLLFGYVGLSGDVLQPDMDALVIGTATRAVPWSEYQRIGDQWYKLEAKDGGKELVATPAVVQTGTLELDYKGDKPVWLVVQGSSQYENCYFDLAGAKSVEVPIGRYRLFYGELRKGKKRQTSKALILPGATTPNWTVAAGETAKVELGAPYSFDFRFQRDGDDVTVEGASVVVIGRAKERYERIWNAVPRPEVSWRKAGGKRGSKGEKMALALDNQAITDYGWKAAWAPLSLTVEVKAGADDAVELQLVQSKHAMFGEIESDWRGGS